MNTNIYHRAPQPFQPNPLIRAADVQTVLARYRPAELAAVAQEFPVLIDGGHGETGWDDDQPVRLLGYYTPSLLSFGSRGLVLILHGWEGCSHSVYNLTVTNACIRAGYDVFRLNMRDHGPGFHVNPYALNRGIFLGTLIDEVAAATYTIAELAADRPFYIVGASLGGNFALRLAIRHAQTPFHNLRKVIALNPAINPARTSQVFDNRRYYMGYFRRRWLNSLRAKQQLFPNLYDFSALETIFGLVEMTEWLVQRYGDQVGDFRSATEYFHAYSVLGDVLTGLTVPTTIITAANDRVVPVVDFYALAPHPLLDLQIHPTGGHVGYMDIFPLRHRLPQLLLAALRAETPAAASA